MKRIVFTGGGSAGHVTPNLAMIEPLREQGWTIDYIGSSDGIEKEIIQEAQVRFHSIASGKLRRYFDLKNIKDPFRVIKGVWQSYRLLRKLKPDVVFSKGGFVTVPVVLGSWLARIPVIIHESDITPGLANKIAVPFARKVCYTFPETKKALSANKAVYTGLPIRAALRSGNKLEGLKRFGFTANKPVLLVMGGSLGAKKINEAVRYSLDELLNTYQVIHICGKGNVDATYNKRNGYVQEAYISSGIPDVLAMADVVVSRAGATSIFEFLAMQKPMLLVPLSLGASRGDQILNAKSFESQGFCQVIEDEALTGEKLLQHVDSLYKARHDYAERMKKHALQDSVEAVLSLIKVEAAASSK